MKLSRIIFALLVFVITGCASTYPETPNGFQKKIIETEYFSIVSWEKEIVSGNPLRIYIEGDGNPRPRRAIALELAARDPDENVIYISRPCQYADSKECKNPLIWGKERFHEEIVDEMKKLIVYLAHKYKTPSLELVGYDGGATMALLVASRIPVAKVITIGGILDTTAYTLENDLEPINGLNPADLRDSLSQVAQVHYVGGRDTQTTRRMAERFVARLYNPKSAIVKIVPSATHTDWSDISFDYYHSKR